jgi:hypothetical protein
MVKFPENFNFNPDKKLTKEENFKLEIKLTEKEIELLKKLMNAIQLYSGSKDIKNPTEKLEPAGYSFPTIETEISIVGGPIGIEVYRQRFGQPIITLFRKKLIPEVDNVKEEQCRKAIEKVLEEMKDYLEKVGIGMDEKRRTC